ncbi:MAG: hypothetical protein LBL62_12395, partial [Planctomycetaceae bacterium]|nr:hypothetical protein [Planctomycetaceae bacterium]
MNQNNDGKWYCLPFWSRVKLNRRNRPAELLINSLPLSAIFRVFCVENAEMPKDYFFDKIYMIYRILFDFYPVICV